MKSSEKPSASILIADDGQTNLRILSKVLSDQGYEVTTAVNGALAVEAAKKGRFDLIMLDINMPEMDGYEACEALKADEATKGTPVIFISALDDPMDKVKAFEAGGADYVVKPFQSAEIVARVDNHLRIARLQREMEVKNIELTRKNEEILRATEELVASYREAASVFSALSSILPGKILDEKYRLENLIGQGGYGAVYRASHLNLDRSVAIKVLRPTATSSPDDLERFRLEGIFTCRVNHPNAIAVWDSGVTKEGIAYLVMELLEGRTLRHELVETKKLSLMRCAEIIWPVCQVLALAHSTGVVHRDIKPDNIFLHKDRGVEVVKVVDFGIATLTRDHPANVTRLHQSSVPVGTPTYIAPERFSRHESGPSSDIYSVGVMLYEMICGIAPFLAPEAFPWAVAHMHLTTDPRPMREINPTVPEAIDALVLRALAKNPDKRPSANELAEEFLHLVSTASTASSRRSI